MEWYFSLFSYNPNHAEFQGAIWLIGLAAWLVLGKGKLPKPGEKDK
jgi:hypothetical protein